MFFLQKTADDSIVIGLWNKASCFYPQQQSKKNQMALHIVLNLSQIV